MGSFVYKISLLEIQGCTTMYTLYTQGKIASREEINRHMYVGIFAQECKSRKKEFFESQMEALQKNQLLALQLAFKAPSNVSMQPEWYCCPHPLACHNHHNQKT